MADEGAPALNKVRPELRLAAAADSRGSSARPADGGAALLDAGNCSIDAFPSQKAALLSVFAAAGESLNESECLCPSSRNPRVSCDATGLRFLSLTRLPLERLPHALFSLTELRTLVADEMGLVELPSNISALSKLGMLSVNSNKLTSLPEEIGALSSLHTLFVNENALTALPSSLFMLSGLVTLAASGNRLSSLPREISGLRNLSVLIVSENRLSELPSEIGALSQLTGLSVQRNSLESLPMEIGELRSLTTLGIAGNRFRELPAAVSSISSLQDLIANDNLLSALPSDMGRLTHLFSLRVANNRLTALPESLCSIPLLVTLALSGNLLSELPQQFGNLSSLQQLSLNHNQLTALPASFSSLIELFSLDLSANLLSTLPLEFGAFVLLLDLDLSSNRFANLSFSTDDLGSLTLLDLSNNLLTSVELDFAALPSLEQLLLSGNLLDSFPASVEQATTLTKLLLDNNRLTAIPGDIGALSALSTLTLSRNALSGLPNSFSALPLGAVDISSNNFTLWNFSWLNPRTINFVNLSSNAITSIVGRCDCSALSTVDVSRNAFTERNGCVLFDRVRTLSSATFLTFLSLAGLRLSSFASCSSTQSLLSLDLSDNDLRLVEQVTVANVLQHRREATIKLNGNPLLRIAATDLLYLDAKVSPPLYFSQQQILCSDSIFRTSSVTARVDPEQRRYANCSCRALEDVRTLWSPRDRKCVEAPFESTAASFSSRVMQDGLLLSTSRGYYPALALHAEGCLSCGFALWSVSDLRLLECHIPSACSPARELEGSPAQEEAEFEIVCASGRNSSSLLCSRCENGHYAVASACWPCAPGAGVFVVLFGLVAACSVFAAAWSLQSRSASSTLGICFFFLQLNEALEESLPLTAASRISAAPSELLGLLYFRPFALECVSSSSSPAVSALWLWVVVVLVIPTASFCTLLVLSRRASLDSRSELRQRALNCVWNLYGLIYLPATHAALATFNREQQESDAPAFVSASPYVLWNSEEHREMIALSVTLIALLVVPLPLLSFRRASAAFASVALGTLRELDAAALVDPSVVAFRDWASRWWWKPVVIDGRRLAVASLVALMPWRSQWLAVSLFLLLIALYSATLIARPYAEEADNRLEASALLVSTLLYCAQVSSNIEGARDSSSLATCVAVLSLCAKCVAFLVVARVASERAGAFATRTLFSSSSKAALQPDAARSANKQLRAQAMARQLAGSWDGASNASGVEMAAATSPSPPSPPSTAHDPARPDASREME